MLKLINILLLCILFNSCITTNYYTARTLDEGKVVLTPALDNIVWLVEDEGVVEKKIWFTPSLGYARGLPWRFEAGIRYYVPYILEANIRHQLNPNSFEAFDLSLNLHSGIYFADGFKDVSKPYLKYGLTISKEINKFQPYFSFYLNKNFAIEDRDNDELSNYSIICFGVAIPHKTNYIFPEINYYKQNNAEKGFFSFGIGIRTSIGD